MSTDETTETGARPITPVEPKVSKNPDNDLARALTKAREGFSRGSAYKWIALAIAVAVGVLGWNYYSASRRASDASLWIEYTSLNASADFKKFIEDHPDTTQGRLAKLQLARLLLGPEGLDKLGTTSADDRKKAIDNVEEGGKLYQEVAAKLEEAALQYEAYTQAARAQETLCATPTEKSPEQMRGSLDKALDLYRKAAALEAKLGQTKSDAADKEIDLLPLALSAKQKADLLSESAKREAMLADYKKIQEIMKSLETAGPKFPPEPKGDFPPGE